MDSLYPNLVGISGGVMVNKLDKITDMSDFESHWEPHSFSFVSHGSQKKLRKFLCPNLVGTWQCNV